MDYQRDSLPLVIHYTSVLVLLPLTMAFGKRMELLREQYKSVQHVVIISIVDLVEWLNIMAVYMVKVTIPRLDEKSMKS